MNISIVNRTNCLIIVSLIIFNTMYSQWTQSTYISAFGVPTTTNFYTCVPDGRGWVAVGGDNGVIINSTSTGIGLDNTNCIPTRTIAFIDNLNGVGYSNDNMTSTSNGGDSWNHLVNIEVGGSGINDVEFVSQTGYACGNSGGIRKYISTGSYPTWLDWTVQTSGVSVNLSAIDVVSTTQAYIVGINGTLLRTMDGTNWTSLSSGTTTNLKDISFKDATHGIALGESGTILMTTNGGDNWTILPHYSILNFNSVKYLSNGSIWIVGQNGLILKSLDDGNSWGSQVSGTTANLNSICVLNGTGYIAGDAATFLYSSANGGTITPVTAISTGISELESSFVSVYPNPSSGIFHVQNGTTNLAQNCRIDVYNMLGDKVLEQINNTEINLSNYGKGQYTLRIQDDLHVFFQRVILE